MSWLLPFLLLTAWVGPLQSAAGTITKQEFSRTINKEFSISADGFTELQNKYGNVTVKVWQQNKVEIDVTIKVNARDQRAAQEVFDRINVVFSNTATSVRAITEIEPNRSWSWFGNNENNFTIHYDVYIPEKGSLTVGNKYGNVATAMTGGQLKLDVKYGDIRAEGAVGSAVVALAYGDGTIDKLNDLDLNMSYSNLVIEQVRNVTGRARYGDLEIRKGVDIRLDSRYNDTEVGEARFFQTNCGYDNYRLSNVGTLVVSGNYTDVKVGQLTQQLTVNLSYGDIEIDRLATSFESVNITVNYTDIKLGVNSSALYSIDFNGNYADLVVPSNLTQMLSEERNSSRRLKAHTQRGKGTGTINIDMSYGDCKIQLTE
jgi:hypothetical protein